MVVARARKEGKTIHLGRLFEIVVIKHDELPEDMKKDKGRIVFQGSNVKDQSGLSAVFAEVASSASLLEASKLLDAIAMLPGCAGQKSDAPKAYTQSLLYGDGRVDPVDTWIELPRNQWPKHWEGMRRPV